MYYIGNDQEPVQSNSISWTGNEDGISCTEDQEDSSFPAESYQAIINKANRTDRTPGAKQHICFKSEALSARVQLMRAAKLLAMIGLTVEYSVCPV